MTFIIRLVLMLLVVAGLLVLLTVLDQPLFKASEGFIVWLQGSDSSFYTVSMNLASNLLNPNICAGYLILLFIVTPRKAQVLRFLVYFCFLSYALCLLKLVLEYDVDKTAQTVLGVRAGADEGVDLLY